MINASFLFYIVLSKSVDLLPDIYIEPTGGITIRINKDKAGANPRKAEPIVNIMTGTSINIRASIAYTLRLFLKLYANKIIPPTTSSRYKTLMKIRSIILLFVVIIF
jgi:hypothetical protein